MCIRWLVLAAAACVLLGLPARASEPRSPGAGERAPKSDKKSRDLARLQGTWRIIDAQFGGDSCPQIEAEKHDIAISGTTYVYRKPNQDPHTSRMKIDATKNPAQIDLTRIEGRFTGSRSRGIYRIEGDRLLICFGWGGNRLEKFQTSSKTLDTLLVLKRIKR